MQSINSPLSNQPVDTIDVLANVNQIVAGTDISTSNGGTGTVVVADTSTLGSVVGRGNTTSNTINANNIIVQNNFTTTNANVTGGVLNVSSNTVTGNLSVLQNTAAGNVSVTQNTFTGNLTVTQNVSAGNVAITANLSVSNIAVTGIANIALDPTTYVFEEDFTHCATFNNLSGSQLMQNEHTWVASNIGSNANCKVVFANPNDGLHIGAVGLNANGTGAGNGISLFLGGGASSIGFLNPNSNVFVYRTAFQLSTPSQIGAFLGFTGNNVQTNVPNVNTQIFIGIRYDTSLGDANLFFVSQTGSGSGIANTWKDSGVAADTNWHKLIMRGYANGAVTFQLDGNNTVATVSPLPSAMMDYGLLQMVTRATGSPQMNVDYLQFMVPGLNR